YGEEYSYQYRLLNLNNDSGIKQLREKLVKLHSDFSRQVYHPKPDVNTYALWNEINSTERIIREKAKESKSNLQVSDADTSQVINKLPKDTAFIEFRRYFPRDLKTGKETKPHLAAYLLFPDAKLLFEDIGALEDLKEAEDLISELKKKKKNLIQVFIKTC
ncbi:MAG: hypothetical protein HC887_11890, partial [Desulfobacteraceae bacterium]|nr:hypothetical protein [Desulfobacteraceae bacterium]